MAVNQARRVEVRFNPAEPLEVGDEVEILSGSFTKIEELALNEIPVPGEIVAFHNEGRVVKVYVQNENGGNCYARWLNIDRVRRR